MISEAWADLGGGLAPPERRARGQLVPRGPHVLHSFDPASGYCACGLRDDGRVGDGTPAARNPETAETP